MASNSGIYKITSSIDNVFYIGSAVNIGLRFTKHKSLLKINTHHNKKLQNHYNKYGTEVLTYSIVEFVENKEDLIIREQFYIDTLRPYFNICKVAGSCLGIKRSSETIAKMSGRPGWNKGLKTPEVVKEKMRISQAGKNLGKKRNDETKAILSKISTGNKNCLGKKASDEKRLKMSLSHIGKKPGFETRQKMSASKFGKIVSEKTRRKLSIANSIAKPYRRGEKRSDETKTKIGLALGKKIINSNTGIVFNNISEAANSANLKRTTLNAMLSGQIRNKTDFEYLIKIA